MVKLNGVPHTPDWPVCRKRSCWAYVYGRCSVLSDNNFKGGKPCPFYKTTPPTKPGDKYGTKKCNNDD